MSTLKLSLLLFFVVILSACGQFSAFEDRRREPGTERVYIGQSTPAAPVICYNPLLEDEEIASAMADAICKKTNPQARAEFKDKNYFSCRLFVPTRAYYTCVTPE